jgi:hypothetical protein
MRSSYAILSLFLVENFKMPTSELELAKNTLFVLRVPLNPGFCRERGSFSAYFLADSCGSEKIVQKMVQNHHKNYPESGESDGL